MIKRRSNGPVFGNYKDMLQHVQPLPNPRGHMLQCDLRTSLDSHRHPGCSSDAIVFCCLLPRLIDPEGLLLLRACI